MLGAPLGLLALLSLLPLAAIYLLQRRSKPREVSSHALWLGLATPTSGGSSVDRPRPPLTAYLEALALLLLALALAQPLLRVAPPKIPTAIVLDDSLSMARPGVRAQVLERLAALLKEDPKASVILAGQRTTLLSDLDTPAAILEASTNLQTYADIDGAIASARSSIDAQVNIVVLTDRGPSPDSNAAMLVEEGAIRWSAVGAPAPNLAISSLVHDGGTVLVAVTSHADAPTTTTLTLEVEGAIPDGGRIDGTTVGELRAVSSQPITVEPGETVRRRLRLATPTEVVRASITEDALAIDNTVYAVAPTPDPVRVEIRNVDSSLATPLRHAIEAVGGRNTHERAEIVFAPPGEDIYREAWRVRIAPGNGESFRDPFAIDRSHPVTQGIDLVGVIWTTPPPEELGADAAPTPPPPATPTAPSPTGEGVSADQPELPPPPPPAKPLILAGRTALLSEHYDEAAPALSLSLDPTLSTLTSSPAFPSLIDNILRWRAAARPGVTDDNIALGARTVFVLNASPESVTATDPDGEAIAYDSPPRELVIQGAKPGVYAVRSDEITGRFAVQPVGHGESDLRDSTSATLGDWPERTATERGYAKLTWVLALLALATLAVHAVLVGRALPKGAA